MWLSNEQQALIAKYRGTNPPSRKHLTRIPERDRRYKCPVCHLVLSSSDLQDGACPVCGEAAALQIMCPLDHTHCPHGVVESLAYCPLCGEPVCPACGSHDVSQMSRITGYISDLKGWNAAKQAEVRDRVRYDPLRMDEDHLQEVEPSKVQEPVTAGCVEA